MKSIRMTMLFLALIIMQSFVNSSPVSALIAAHLNYDGCYTCHNLHGSPSQGSLLAELNTETTCLSCHGPLNPFGITEAVIHDPLANNQGNMGYITCRECHNPHDNIGSNVKLIGYAYDPETGISAKEYEQQPNPLYPAPGEPEFISVLVADNYDAPAIRIELSTSDINSPVFSTVTFTGSADFNIGGTFPGPGVCQICHSPNHNAGADCTGCHPHNTGFKPKSCTDIGCHDGNGAGALAINNNSSHSLTATGYGCVDCHNGHNAGDFEVPNNLAVGINYGSNGESGIALADPIGTATTEAEICWNCHAFEGISEWGQTTTDTNGSFPNFNYGSLNQDNWIGATWSSANFQYKSNTIQSTHAANATDGVAGVDLVDDIRCSYCHDVHDLNAANGDTLSGSPYLRGTWMGNPYREDGAPRWDGATQDRHSYAENQTFGAVPRGNRGPDTSHYRTTEPPNDAYNYEMGGYWIDQNSGFPTRDTAYDTATETSSLCELCHGDGDGVWDATEIDSIDEFVGNNWLGTNGHANSVVSGSGTASGNAFNIFTNGLRGNALSSVSADSLAQRRAYTNTGGMGYFGWPSGSRLWGVRNNNEKSWYIGTEDTGTGVFPVAENPQQWGDARRAFHSTYGSGFEWGNYWVSTDPDVTQDNATTDDRYHQFTCSKCHNPHASRLPRLMISNCLDVRNNTWDDQTTFDGRQGYAGDSDWTDSGIDYTSMVQSPGDKELAYTLSAQNCHRAVDASTGWNIITPPNSPAGVW